MADIDRLIGFMAIMQVPFMNDPDALAYIEEVKTVLKQVKAQEPGWISVKDRMPEKQTPVLVYVPPYSDEDEEYIGHVAMSYYTHSARGGYWAGTDGNNYGAIGIIHEPTHWMPLPSAEGLDET